VLQCALQCVLQCHWMKRPFYYYWLIRASGRSKSVADCWIVLLLCVAVCVAVCVAACVAACVVVPMTKEDISLLLAAL